MEMIDILKKTRIDPLAEIKEPPTYCYINKRPSLTSGNFSLINGKKKAGKTFLLGSIIASTINNSLQIDSIQGSLPKPKNNVLYFDTEQSQYHVTRSVKRICSMAGISNPNNLYAYGLRSLSTEERLQAIENAISTIPNVGIIAIDGIRDLLSRGINDEQEATKLCNQFLKWSNDNDMHIILLLHQNKNDLNARGHIGSEVVNKAETIITVTKEEKNHIFKISCEASRDIPFDDFGFTISEDGLPISCELTQVKYRKITDPSAIPYERHLEILKKIYSEWTEYSSSDLKSKIMDMFNLGRDASEKFILYYKERNWIIREQRGRHSYYRFNKNTTLPLYILN